MNLIVAVSEHVVWAWDTKKKVKKKLSENVLGQVTEMTRSQQSREERLYTKRGQTQNGNSSFGRLTRPGQKGL